MRDFKSSYDPIKKVVMMKIKHFQ